jgi:hypothetical protein
MKESNPEFKARLIKHFSNDDFCIEDNNLISILFLKELNELKPDCRDNLIRQFLSLFFFSIVFILFKIYNLILNKIIYCNFKIKFLI